MTTTSTTIAAAAGRHGRERDRGRKFRLAWVALWVLAGLTAASGGALVVAGEAQLAADIFKVGFGAISGLIGIYLGSQSYIDRHRGELLSSDDNAGGDHQVVAVATDDDSELPF